MEIHEGKAEFYSGNYSFYAVEKERRYEEKLKQYENNSFLNIFKSVNQRVQGLKILFLRIVDFG